MIKIKSVKSLFIIFVLLTVNVNFAGPLDAPSAEVSTIAKGIVQTMIENPRGPYSRIHWVCKDGTKLPPKAYACESFGGGHQYAEYSEQQIKLAKLGWSVGTIFTPLAFEQLKTAAPREQRLRELPLERYLMDIDDGWVLRKAQYYRGRVQQEDEQIAGRQILLDAVTDTQWLHENYLLLRELARVIPHGSDTDLSRRIRRAAIELAEYEPTAEPWRALIHASPNLATAVNLRLWANKLKDKTTRKFANALADDLEMQFGSQGHQQQLNDQLAQLQDKKAKAWGKKISTLLNSDGAEKITGLCLSTAIARRELISSLGVNDRLALVDALVGIEAEVKLSFYADRSEKEFSRSALLQQSKALLNCVYGAGLISANELKAVNEALSFSSELTIATADYQNGIAQLKRLPAWAVANVRYTFAEALVRYTALDSRALRFSDDLLRGSPLVLLGEQIKSLSQDLSEITGSEVKFSDTVISNALALNPGLARGHLKIYETLDLAQAALTSPSDIVVLPETIAELKPVAGILTLGEGNALSHVQLLARNFGIPNVAINSDSLELLRPLEGKEVFLIVSSNGNVVLKAVEQAQDILNAMADKNKIAANERITVPAPDLSLKTVLPLAEIHRGLSGKVVGPKAANLGELNRLFPGHVAPALAIPFGIYSAHLTEQGLKQRLNAVYKGFENGDVSESALGIELIAIREAIAALSLSSETQQNLQAAMLKEFGPLTAHYGLFLRSDTNVEDLPQFTGAGLSETVANVVGQDQQFATVPRVWASVLSPRALAWRSSLLTNPEEIYASVLLMKSVPSEKSGVLVTSNLANPNEPGLTVSTAWGVGGAVSGEAAESLVLKPNGSVILVSEAKTPYRRKLAIKGGVDWVPAADGSVLTQDEIQLLRKLADEVEEKYTPVFDEFKRKRPWDIEFGFVDGKLSLFQIRPLVEKNTQRADLVMHRLRKNKPVNVESNLDLTTPVKGLSL